MPSIRSRRVVLPNEIRPATITFVDGVVVDIGAGRADHDFGDLVILPGLVDTHVHANEPGRTQWEGFATATRAAAAGGTTTIVDMPLNSIPPTVDVAALEAKREAARPNAAVDVAFWGGIVPGAAAGISDLATAGVCGFKAFLVDSGVPEFPPMTVDSLRPLLSDLKGTPLLVHAEDPAYLVPPAGDPRSYASYLATRPAMAESRAVDAVASLALSHPVHILHVSSADAVESILRHRREGGLSAETCPHYLTFDAAEIPDGSTPHKCAPPIRHAEHREALWDALAEGTLDMVTSDHSPAPPHVKSLDTGDMMAAWGGIASIELRLSATWDGARSRGHGFDRLAEWLAAAPARLAGLDGSKGEIAQGLDADFVVFDPDGVTMVDAAQLQQRHPVSPYHGMRLAGAVVTTFLAGVVVQGPSAVNERRGRLLRRGD